MEMGAKPQLKPTLILLALAVVLGGCNGEEENKDAGPVLEAGGDAVGEAGGDGGGDAGKTWPVNAAFRAGFAAVKITPTKFEGFIDRANNGEYDTAKHTYKGVSYAADLFLDSGTDRKFDFQEADALGVDGKPGKAGVDDDGDKVVDDLLGCHPADDPSKAGSKGCEYMATGSDDKADPAGDNYHKTKNPGGTEKDDTFQKVVIGGYGGVFTSDPVRPAQGVHDDLWARAMVVSQGKTPFALVVVDLPGYLHVFGNPARREISAKTGIPVGNIIYMATHNHEGPDTVGIWAGPNDLDFDYIKKVNQGMVDAVVKAVAAMVPAKLKSATAQVAGCYDQKTLRFKDGGSCNFPVGMAELKANPSKYDVPVNQIDLRDPMVYNHRVTALLATDAASGKTLGTLVNFANHPEVLGGSNNMLSSDYPHYVRVAMEKKYGGTCVFASGTTGGQIGTLHGTKVPLYDKDGKLVADTTGKKDADGKAFPEFAPEDTNDPLKPAYDKIRSQGYVAANAAIKGLEAATVEKDPKVSVASGDLDIPMTNTQMGLVMIMIENVAKQKGYLKHTEDLPISADYCPSDTGRKACIRIKMAAAKIGDLTIVNAPGEPCPEYLHGRQASEVDFGAKWGVSKYAAMPSLATQAKTSNVMMLTIANGYLGYMTPEAEYLKDEKHPNYYEELGSAGRLLGDTVGNKLLKLLGAPASVTFNASAKVKP